MDFPEKKAGSMDPVTVAKKTPRPVDVRAWALFTACATAFSLAVGYSMSHAHALDHFHAPCWQWQVTTSRRPFSLIPVPLPFSLHAFSISPALVLVLHSSPFCLVTT